MGNQSSDQAFADVGDVISANLRRLRTARRMSLATLASRADVAKATLANLEQGRGNPTIETLWSLALGLGVAFSDLLEDRRETTMVVVRAQQGARVRGSTPGGQLDLRLLDRIERGGLVEVFDLFLPARTDHLGSPHGTGVAERVFVHAGTITVGPASDPVTLGPGDYARYSGDGPHVYRSAEEDVHGMLLVGYPPALGALMTGFDYLVVGGGAAGCIVAARLAEDPAVSVGPPAATHWPHPPQLRLRAGRWRGEGPCPHLSRAGAPSPRTPAPAEASANPSRHSRHNSTGDSGHRITTM
jgi:transcriptional regulator with XRE-family HTH domain